jgi:hypothetical protein
MARIILILTALSLGCYAAEVVLTRNTGGLNSKASPVYLEDHEASDLLNVNLDTDGAIRKRGGYSQFNAASLSAQVDGMARYVAAAGSIYMIAYASAIYQSKDFSGAFSAITGSTAITGSNPMNWELYEDTLIMTNGADIPQEWAGTGTAADSQCNSDISLTKAKTATEYDNRLFLGNVTVSATAYPNRLYYSGVADKDAWSVIDFLKIGDAFDPITQTTRFADWLVATKEESIWRVQKTGDSTAPYSISRSRSEMGCLAGGSVRVINNLLICYSRKGLILFDGYVSEVISYKVQPTIEAYDYSNLVSGRSAVFTALNQYWFSVADGDSGDQVLIWDYFHNAFLKHDGIHASALLTIPDDNNQERLYTGDFSGHVYRQNQGLNDTPAGVDTAINGYYDTKNFFMDTLMFTKKPLHLNIIYAYTTGSDNLNVGYTYNLASGNTYNTYFSQLGTGALWDTGIWDEDVWFQEGSAIRRVDMRSQGRTVRFRFSNASLDETFSLFGFSVGYDMGGVGHN